MHHIILQLVCYTNCQQLNILKNGKTPKGKQRFICRDSICDGRTFILEHSDPERFRQVKQHIVDIALNGGGTNHDFSNYLGRW